MLNNMVTDSFSRQSDIKQNKIQLFAFVIAVSASVCLSIYLAVLSLPGFDLSGEIKVDGQINPNDAPSASLVRLPGIGMARAEAIVAYRENFSKRGDDSLAFRNCDDLRKVKGIGPKTVENICEWLRFE